MGSPENGERFRYGPFSAERQGRFVKLSVSDKIEYKKAMKNLKEEGEQTRENIAKNVKEICGIIIEYDQFVLLANLTMLNFVSSSSQITESQFGGNEGYVEYGQSLILSLEEGSSTPPSIEIITRFQNLILSTYDMIKSYYFGETASEPNVESQIRFLSLMTYLTLRGDSYPAHHLELFKDLFLPLDQSIQEKYGFSLTVFIEFINELEQNISKNISSYFKDNPINIEIREKYEERVIIKKEVSKEEFFNSEEIKKLQSTLYQIPSDIFKVKIENTSIRNICESMCLEFGENSNFIEYEDAPGWSTNNTLINQNPLIKKEGEYYCFNYLLLFRNIIPIFENILFNIGEKFYNDNYISKKSKYLENKTIEYFKEILNNPVIFQNLYYEMTVDKETRRYETDGLVIFDNNLFIIEAKSHKLTLSSRRGGLIRFEKDVKKIIGDAYSQAVRTKKYFLETKNPKFEFENKQTAIEFNNKFKKKIKHIFLINTSIDNLGFVSSQMDNLRQLNIIEGDEWPWSIFINDLKIISEINERPSYFIAFLKSRIRANEFPNFRTIDELDFYMWFLREGLYINKMKETEAIFPHGYTEILDDYYYGKMGIKPEISKPQIIRNREILKLVKKIGESKKNGYSEINSLLINVDKETQDEIIDRIRDAKRKTKKDNIFHDVTFRFKEMNCGITFFVGSKRSKLNADKIKKYCKEKLKEYNYTSWYLIVIKMPDKIYPVVYYR